MTSRLYVDMTTISQEIGRHPHGTTRVERGIVGCLARLDLPGVRFVAYQPATRGFALVPSLHAYAVATAPAVPEPAREPEPAWRRHPLIMRARVLRRRLRARWRRPTAQALPRGEDPFLPDSTLLLPSEHDRQDFAHLIALKRNKGLSLAFVFYDLLHVLEDDDPRLRDANAADIPQTDFMVREASLILPISHYSGDTLRNHLKRRGVTGPPIMPIRLAGEVPPGEAKGAVADLEPGRFVLSVGDVVYRKNHALLVEVWRALAKHGPPLPLVIAGRVDQEGEALVQSVKRDPLLRDHVRFIANADDAALGWLYRHCRFTVFPSLLEGFGLPVAESLACGKVCLASTASAIPEAGQGAAIGLDPHDGAAWVEAVRLLSRDDTALAEHEARIARDFRPVSWRDTVDDILGAIAASGA